MKSNDHRQTRPASHRMRDALAGLTLLTWVTVVVAQPVGQLPSELVPYFGAIKTVESKGHPWSIYNNTISKSYKFNTRQEAESKAAELLALGHNLDLGLMQLNWKYQGKREGVTLANIFDPVTNEGIAKQVLVEFWQQAQRLVGDFNRRIMAAVGAYNNGRVNLPNPSYVQKVWSALGKPVSDLPPDVAPAGSTSSSDPAIMERMGKLFGKKSKRLTEQEANSADPEKTSQEEQDPSSNDSGWMGLLAGAGLLAVGIFGGVLLIKFFGIVKALRVAKVAASATKARAKNLQNN